MNKEKRREYDKQWRESHCDYRKQYYAKNRERILAQGRKSYLKNRDRILAHDKKMYSENIDENRRIAKEYYQTHKEQMYGYHKKWAIANREMRRATSRACRKSLRMEVVKAYGGCCQCCGEVEFPFLTLEHTRRDGKLHRIQTNGGVYEDLKRRGFPKDGYTIMCFNCNVATKNGDLCPHKQKLKDLIPLKLAV